MTTIIDYGVGNLFSLYSSFKKIGEDVIVTSDKSIIYDSKRIVLPGVGAFKDASEKLFNLELDYVLQKCINNGTSVIGICLGMQLLFQKSREDGIYNGLGIIPGEVIPIDNKNNSLKIPHMGWNRLEIIKNHYIFDYLQQNEYVYFVHSYYANTDVEYINAVTEYGDKLTAVVSKDNVIGCQFHPEKSGQTGLNIIKAFCNFKG